jgi:hypothetical protein
MHESKRKRCPLKRFPYVNEEAFVEEGYKTEMSHLHRYTVREETVRR